MTATKPNNALSTGLYLRLSLMMFLEWFIMGAWYMTVGNYMTKIGMSSHIFWAYTVVPVSALISPYFLGLAADRYFASERLLGALHIVGGLAMFCAPWVAEPPVGSVVLFIGLLMVHALCFAPSIGLTGSLAFHHLSHPERQFPLIRVFGTIGWIAAGYVVSKHFHADEDALSLRVAGLAGLALGAYSFTLPSTPPAKAGQAVALRKIIDWEALRGLASRPFVIFMGCVFLIFIPMSAYYTYAPVFVKEMGLKDPAFQMTFGQMSEIFFMLAIPVLFARLGVKWMVGAGMAAWALRYGLFSGATAGGSPAMIMGAIIVHGICFDFLYVVGQIYVDKKSTPANRGQAQGLYVLVTTGLGQVVGTQATGWLFNCLVEQNQHARGAWQIYWAIPAIFAGLVVLAFVVWFRDPEAERTE
jgi:nucleoside transporter